MILLLSWVMQLFKGQCHHVIISKELHFCLHNFFNTFLSDVSVSELLRLVTWLVIVIITSVQIFVVVSMACSLKYGSCYSMELFYLEIATTFCIHISYEY